MTINHTEQSAFPMEAKNGDLQYGLSKLEYFAGLAMQSLLRSIAEKGADSQLCNIAPAAFEIARAMIEEAKKVQYEL